MKKMNPQKLLLGVLCVVLLTALMVMFLNPKEPPINQEEEIGASEENEMPSTETEDPVETEEPEETEDPVDVVEPTEDVENETVERSEESSDNKEPVKEDDVDVVLPEIETPEEPTETPEESTEIPDASGNTPVPPDGGDGGESNNTNKPVDEEEVPEVPEDEEDPGLEFSFPYEIPEYGLIIEAMGDFGGAFLEDGYNVNVQDTAMMLIRNDGELPIEYMQICVEYENESLLFEISALPQEERLVVQEKNGNTIPDEMPRSAAVTDVRWLKQELSENRVRVIDNGNNTLTVRNLTEDTLPVVRICYKYYMKNEDIFVGGIAYTIQLSNLEAGERVIVRPSHYNSKTCRVVMVMTYESEV